MRKELTKILLIATALLLVACGKEEKSDGPTAVISSKPDAHEHQWIEASCVEPRTCIICGATEGGTIDHDWFEATCYMPKTCKYCGLEEGDMIDHEWTRKGIVVPSVCTMCGLSDGCLPNYFDEHGIHLEGPIHANVMDEAPQTFEQQYILLNERNVSDFVVKTAQTDVSVYSNPDYEDDTKMIYNIVLGINFEYNDPSRPSSFASTTIADLYTGVELEKKVSRNTDQDQYSAVIEVEGVEYELSWTEYTNDYSKTFSFTVPAEYKGLVLSINKVDQADAAFLQARIDESKGSRQDASRAQKYVTGRDTYILVCE